MSLPPFQVFFDRHQEEVYRFLLARVGPQDAEDCLQETFLSALRAYPRLGERSNLRAWVMTIAHHKMVDLYRASGRRPLPMETLPEPLVEPPDPPDPRLWQAVAELPAKQRAAVVHRYRDGLAYADIASRMGSSEEAARQNVRQGLRKLREVRR